MRRCLNEVRKVFRFTHLHSFTSLSANKKRVIDIYKETMRRCLKEVRKVFRFSHFLLLVQIKTSRDYHKEAMRRCLKEEVTFVFLIFFSFALFVNMFTREINFTPTSKKFNRTKRL